MIAIAVTKHENRSSWSLTCDGSLRSRLFFPPQRHKHGDVTNPPVPKPLHGQLDPPARKHLLIPVAVKQRVFDRYVKSQH